MSDLDEPPQVTTVAGVTWRRTGYCCKCGECCRGNPFDKAAGGMCPLFRWVAEGEGHCTDRTHPYYLSGCNVYPQEPDQVADKPKCTYRFERIG